jgi:hypothetical protein
MLPRVALRGARDGPEEACTLGANLRDAAFLARVAAAVDCGVVGLARKCASAAIAGSVERSFRGGRRRKRRALAAAVAVPVAVAVAVATPSAIS